jgi:hypothetical protein
LLSDLAASAAMSAARIFCSLSDTLADRESALQSLFAFEDDDEPALGPASTINGFATLRPASIHSTAPRVITSKTRRTKQSTHCHPLDAYLKQRSLLRKQLGDDDADEDEASNADDNNEDHDDNNSPAPKAELLTSPTKRRVSQLVQHEAAASLAGKRADSSCSSRHERRRTSLRSSESKELRHLSANMSDFDQLLLSFQNDPDLLRDMTKSSHSMPFKFSEENLSSVSNISQAPQSQAESKHLIVSHSTLVDSDDDLAAMPGLTQIRKSKSSWLLRSTKFSPEPSSVDQTDSNESDNAVVELKSDMNLAQVTTISLPPAGLLSNSDIGHKHLASPQVSSMTTAVPVLAQSPISMILRSRTTSIPTSLCVRASANEVAIQQIRDAMTRNAQDIRSASATRMPLEAPPRALVLQTKKLVPDQEANRSLEQLDNKKGVPNCKSNKTKTKAMPKGRMQCSRCGKWRVLPYSAELSQSKTW